MSHSGTQDPTCAFVTNAVLCAALQLFRLFIQERALLLPLLRLVPPWQPPGASSGGSTQPGIHYQQIRDAATARGGLLSEGWGRSDSREGGLDELPDREGTAGGGRVHCPPSCMGLKTTSGTCGCGVKQTQRDQPALGRGGQSGKLLGSPVPVSTVIVTHRMLSVNPPVHHSAQHLQSTFDIIHPGQVMVKVI
ncbi:hypothetical protein D4764_18G0006940 [Takifugu flavidus]|uniref:Uncharacterized protein n=1 Tax=Takifugu flavidus TaxID=433684 RepID=A0A5C6NSY0_9TELE|nr:hypothetical protein D4764_18G0006940 [Takifugu flavidus]